MARLKPNAGRARRRVRRIPAGRLAAPPLHSGLELLRYMGGGGASPHPKRTRGAGSESAGYHGDLSVPGYEPETPTTAPPPGAAPTGPAGDYSGADRAYARAVRALPPPAELLPAPVLRPSLTRRQAAATGTLLGRLLSPSGALGMLGASLGQDAPSVSDPVSHRPAALARNPDQNPATAVISSVPGRHVDPDPLGARTPGDASAAELVDAARQGTLRIGPGGRVTTPPERQALRQLGVAQRAVERATGPLPGLDPGPSKVARIVFRRGLRAGATPKELLAAAETGLVESGFRNLDYGDADSQGWRQERTSLYGTGPNGPTNVPASADRFFAESVTDTNGTRGRGMTAGELAQTIQASAFPERYDQVKPQAAQLLRAFQEGVGADPKAVQQLRVAKQNARAEGINPTPFNGDVTGGDGNYTIVRADAKGMVDWVESAVGVSEGSPKQMRWAGRFGLGATQPWCANFVSNGLLRRGITDLPSNPNYVPSYESEWGAYAVPLAKAKPGDLVTFSGSHIGVYVGNGEMISGNSSDAVSRTPVGSPSMVIRPPYKGGKVRVADSQLAGSTSTSALGGGVSSVPAGAGLTGGQAATMRPAIGPLTQLTSPLAAGPVLPSELLEGGEDSVSGAAETLLALLGEGSEPGAILPRRALL